MSARKRYEVRVVHPSVAVPDRVARVLATDANDALNRGVKKIFGRSASFHRELETSPASAFRAPWKGTFRGQVVTPTGHPAVEAVQAAKRVQAAWQADNQDNDTVDVTFLDESAADGADLMMAAQAFDAARAATTIEATVAVRRQADSWDAKDLHDGEGKNFMLRFLPYLETLDGENVEKTIGYPNPHKGYGYGRWEELFPTLEEARKRMKFLADAKVIEDAEIYQLKPRRLVDEWKEEQQENVEAGA